MNLNNLLHHEASVLHNLVAFPGDIKTHGITPDFFSHKPYARAFEHLLHILSTDQDYSFDHLVDEISKAARIDNEEIMHADVAGVDYHIKNAKKYQILGRIEEKYKYLDQLPFDEFAAFIEGLKCDLKHEQIEAHDLRMDTEEYKAHLKDQGEKEAHGFITGFNLVDKTCPIERGQLVTIAARPSVGKTAIALNMAYSMAQYGAIVHILSLEMGPKELMSRIYAHISGQPAWKFKYGKADQIYIDSCTQEIKGMTGNIIVKYLPGADLSSVIQNAGEPDVLVLDHIDIMDIPTNKLSEASAIGQVTSALKALAGKRDMAVICLSQFNRQAGTQMPELHQLRGSGAKEQDSDTVLILHRDLEPDSAEPPVLRIAKNRHGGGGITTLQFDGPTMTFKDIA